MRHFADRVAVMYLGRVVEEDATERIMSAPRHPYTQALLASVPSLDPDRRGVTRRALWEMCRRRQTLRRVVIIIRDVLRNSTNVTGKTHRWCSLMMVAAGAFYRRTASLYESRVFLKAPLQLRARSLSRVHLTRVYTGRLEMRMSAFVTHIYRLDVLPGVVRRVRHFKLQKRRTGPRLRAASCFSSAVFCFCCRAGREIIPKQPISDPVKWVNSQFHL